MDEEVRSEEVNARPAGRLERLQSRPKEQKKVFAGTIAIIVMAVLFLIWAFVFFRDIAEAPAVETTETNTAETL
jgi:hypothetical protein